MGRPRARLDWHYDDTRQQFTTPSGRVISLHEIARLLADHVNCRFDFVGPWSGWKMRGDALIPPGTPRGGPRLKPDTGRHLARWITDATAGPSQAPVALTAHGRTVRVGFVEDAVRRLLDDLAVKARLTGT